ncbi:succinate dehydrogenase/fumarate reductase iron-sulfur subunit [Synechococcales cyanobacterium C]|uniref:Fumarate reductase iron-sulfur subunit n=1 Tax=Petrachloros mirabilis ULC683 TaxID=2781853 RepID=A0A8K1ZXU9_9CYAN|nr:succinate dehydrogenase/fumarate reductase iron-sulfur subunit [Petrachloros mirabilis]NCJ05873.1 succinate dehydrogenase/fumarate reductase iron-sulfur subunit [Petrachloros mirabilis ULC683]
MQILVNLIRQQHQERPRVQSYTLEVEPSITILDCLNQIKWTLDGSLSFRKNCRNTICGSCAIRINGRAALACKQNVGQELERSAKMNAQLRSAESPSSATSTPEITLAPLGNMPVIKDLVVDMGSFWHNLETVQPYISTAGRQVPEREFLQVPADRAQLDQTGNCIMCGACYSDCNALEVSGDFVGPHALAKGYRTLADSRDTARAERLSEYQQGTAGVWGCTRCFNCNTVCPMDVAPLDQINRIKSHILAQETIQPSRAVRHRKVLVDLVQQGGWIDERKFGLRVLGNGLRDWRGLWSLLPLGLAMVMRRKFPVSFQPSPGTNEVRSLINSVKMHESDS